MKCLDEETIEGLVTGFLAEDVRSDAAGHLRECPACREAVRKTVLVYRVLDRVFAEETREDCPSGEELARYDEGTLDSGGKPRTEKHLKTCVRCAADLYELRKQREMLLAFEHRQESETHFPAAEAIPFVCTAAAVSPTIERWVQQSVSKVYKFPEAVRLACFAPQAQQQRRLAAATGPGFQKQLLETGQSPFQVEMIQFGEEVRLGLWASEETAEYSDCIARLVLTEGHDVRLTRLILVRNGRGGCVLRPDEVLACTPERQVLSAAIEVIDTGLMLQGVGEAEVVETLVGLLKHGDPSVRRSAIELLAESGRPQAAEAIAPLQKDTDEAVRTAAVQALERLASQ